MVTIAIVGLGPWGVCALERLVTATRHGLSNGRQVQVHVVEPAAPGSGIYDVSQPDYFLLNNPCGQLSLYPYESEDDQPCYGIGLFDWAVAQGYRWTGDQCVIDPAGAPIEAHHFLPRRLMGEYLQWFYHALVAGAPPTVQIVYHPTVAVDIVARGDGRELVALAGGDAILADQVIVTSGHTANAIDADGGGLYPAEVAPYPVESYLERAGAGCTIGVSGMGLVALDVVMALTVGRGGRFADDGAGLRYHPSGQEPVIEMFSRSGLPFKAKSVTGSDLAGAYQPVICTPEALSALRGAGNGGRRLVDVRRELLPLMFAEMHVRYYTQVALQSDAKAAATVGERLGGAWRRGTFEQALGRLRHRYGHFDPEAVFFGHEPRYGCRADYEAHIYSDMAEDLREAEVPDGASPVKTATEVFRIFRDPMRSVVEQGGLSLDSYLDFNADIRSRIHRLVAGPPALRIRQLLALMDAGLVRTPYGPAPELGPADGEGRRVRGHTRISSTTFEQPHAGEAEMMIRGRLDEPRVDGSASRLLSELYNRGRVSQFRYGAVPVGSVHLTPESHPVDVDGHPQERLWMFGVLTEGIRHFTNYIPSPRSRIRAFEDLGACVDGILC